MARRADALACGGLCIAAIGVGTGAAVGWTLRETEVVGKDDPPEGLTADALITEVYNTAQTRQSTNASTFMDNQNILDGAQNAAYAEGKVAAIEALNNQESQSSVTSAGQTAVDDWETTVKKNLLKTWNESVSELRSLYTALSDHPDAVVDDVLTFNNGSSLEASPPDNTITLPDGTDFTLKTVSRTGSNSYEYDPTQRYQTKTSHVDVTDFTKTITYLRFSDWNPIYTEIGNIADTVRNGISTWVEGVYDQVQSGDLDTAELLTPRELAQLSGTEQQVANQAVADLLALNIPVDLEREAKINIPSANSTLYGLLGVTDTVTLNAGDTVDPSTTSEDYYLTYDISEANGTWEAYNTGIDGGVVTFTSEPHPGVVYQIDTVADESVTVPSEDFTGQDTDDDDENEEWTVDLTGDLETAITDISSVKYYADTEETENVTVQLDETFEIVSFTNTDTGEETDSVTYESPAEPETDDNYITKEEWEQREQKYNELIDKYEEQTSGGGGFLGGLGGLMQLPTMIIAAIVAALLLGNN
jgi:hypothetical protein